MKPRSQDNLYAALTQAAEHAVSAVRPNRPKNSKEKNKPLFTVNRRAFSRNFKQLWFYSNTFEKNNSLNSVTGTVFFLFWKNMSVTNLAINELVALVRLHSKSRLKTDSAPIANTYFVSDSDYTSFIEEIWTSFLGEQPLPRHQLLQRIEEVALHLMRFHRQSLERTVILEYYHTSALLHIPAFAANRLAKCRFGIGLHTVGRAGALSQKHRKGDEGRLDCSAKSLSGPNAREEVLPRSLRRRILQSLGEDPLGIFAQKRP